MFAADITWRRLFERHLNALAFTDALTGLANRARILDRLRDAIVEARSGNSGLAVFMADLDGLKRVNDSFGHQAGDIALQVLARRFQEHMREHDMLGRLGGDEFCAVLPDLGESDACLIAERLRAAVAELGVWHEQVLVHTSASIGVAGCDRVTDETMAGLVHAADAALYRAKRTGGDRVALASEGSGLDEARDGRAGPSVLSG